MSDQINLQTDNLCTSEEAFEKFQAVSMYEEDEYITLSDILPPDPVCRDSSSHVDEIPYDNEVVLSSNTEEQLCDVNSQPAASYKAINQETELPHVNISELNPPAQELHQNSQTLESESAKSEPVCETISEEIQGELFDNPICEKTGDEEVHPKNKIAAVEAINDRPRRGRKRKNLTENTTGTLNVTNNSESSLYSQESIDYPESNTPQTQGRRGRKPKNKSASILTDTLSPNNDIPGVNSIVETGQTVRKSSGRRGRPRKVPLQPNTVNTDQQTNGDNKISSEVSTCELNDSKDSSFDNLAKKAPGRRGRPKKLLTDVSTSNAKAPVTESTTSTDLSSTRSEIVDTSASEAVQRVPGRRGRPKKPPVSMNVESDTNKKNVHEDDDDNLSLSKLKGNSLEGTKLIKIPPDEETFSQTEKKEFNKSELPCDNKADDDETDDMSLSKLKQTFDENASSDIIPETEGITENLNEISAVDAMLINDIEVKESPTKRNSKILLKPDFEYNVDTLVAETADKKEEAQEIEKNDDNDSYLVEDTSKRPVRRKAKQALHYDEGSDEDPFANMELSDDDDEPRRKGKKYYSDDEYIPGGKKGKNRHVSSSLDTSDSDIDEILEGVSKTKRKRGRNSGSQSKSPRKRNKTEDSDDVQELPKISPNVTTIEPKADGEQDDIEICLQSSVIVANDEQSKKQDWDATNEFESFIAHKIHGTALKIKKVSAAGPSQSVPLDIPVIDPKEMKKAVDVFTQTNVTQTATAEVQTTSPYEVPMKENVSLTADQSIKACEFLKNVVTTTAELGKLMTQKSDDFISKKINTTHVTDTFKMDYCVRKSFLLFKLAKHNLVQMEEDLSKQYEEFLKSNNLLSCREEPKKVSPKNKVPESDSDCEIVEETVEVKSKKEKPKFNPRTVFLNKELSIKIAKKSTPENKKGKEKINIKGRSAVWISDSVMVKKVKPMQSFLAQDSRNKKPPDCYITEKMVSDFFREYYRQQALTLCAPFTAKEWLSSERNYVCSYFFVKPEEYSDTNSSFPSNGELCVNETINTATISDVNKSNVKSATKMSDFKSPVSLLTLCTQTLQKHLHLINLDLAKESHCDSSSRIPDLKEEERPETLFRLCLNTLNTVENTDTVTVEKSKNVVLSQVQTLFSLCCKKILEPVNIRNSDTIIEIQSLQSLCYKRIMEQFAFLANNDIMVNEESAIKETSRKIVVDDDPCQKSFEITSKGLKQKIKPLFTLCVELIQEQQKTITDISRLEEYYCLQKTSIHEPDSLKLIALKAVKFHLYRRSSYDNFGEDNDHYLHTMQRAIDVKKTNKVKTLAIICFENISAMMNINRNYMCSTAVEELTINSVNTLSEEAFHNIGDSCGINENSSYEEEDTIFYDDFNTEYNDVEENCQTEDNNWVARVQMQELKSCFFPTDRLNRPETNGKQIPQNNETNDNDAAAQSLGIPGVTHIKIEPLDEIFEGVDSSVVKIEPAHSPDEMTMIPNDPVLDPIVTKQENIDDNLDARRNSCSFDENTFENFVRTNKMMFALNEENSTEEIFSQSATRVRKQYEPDSDNENNDNDMAMSLLIPQTFETLHIESAKGSLMESSSDECSSNKKLTTKKKVDKRKGRVKKGELKQNKDIKEKVPPVNEVAKLTKKMRDRIRQEEKKNQSSDSETESIPLNLRKDKERKDNEKLKAVNEKSAEIQCNNIDSTEQIDKNLDDCDKSFTGFSAVDQNEITSYQKYVKFVYDKILPKVIAGDKMTEDKNIPLISSDHCATKVNKNLNDKKHRDAELTSEDHCSANVDEVKDKDLSSKNDTRFEEDQDAISSPLLNYDEPAELLECEPTLPIFENDCEIKPKKGGNKPKAKKSQLKEKELDDNKPVFTERDGWHCYAIDINDAKIYQSAEIVLEKLPESFVETYFQYQNINYQKKEDKEVDRLTNLNTLNRPPNIKEGKMKARPKCKQTAAQVAAQAADESELATAESDHCAELTPSEDERNVDDEVPPPVTSQHTSENNLAKNSLMNDNDSDTDGGGTKIKEEPVEPQEEKLTKRKAKANPKVAEKVSENPDSLMLTADKMMNKELNLLHAPIVLNDESPEKASKGPNTRKKNKSPKSYSTRDRIKNEEDSSSEEEKQWVTTKEKLLKRMGKRQDSAIVDDAKRAKLVSEFIERRGDAPEMRKRPRGPQRRRRSSKKLLEREKQLRVLSKELFGETSADGRLPGKQASQSYFKGRRNIRKVIDKKSLARGTVIANMEEFERKRRLNQRQNRLRELLGCEEDVNVLVINDEVCLEYDFEEQRPVVTVHPFFTKVMKAHQYEGVKFMWDACFESLEKIESGHPGGGCILAHCMGLGKTLQVLALLHTVLTHPRVGMQRVLVCCPLSTVLNWVDEIHKWIGPVTDQIKVFELSKLKKTYERAYQLEDWYNGGGIFIIGYELFRSLSTLDALLDDIRPTIVNKIRTALLDPGPDIIVCDEGHLLKNDCSVLAVAMSRVVTKRRIVLTGTPMQNNLREYYCMVNFIKPNLLGTYSEYSNRFENPIMNGQHRDSREEDIKLMKQRTHILHKVLEGCLQRQEASVLYPYLPKKHEYTVFISLTKCQWDLYKHYLQNYANKQAKQSILKDFHTLQKIWSHPQVLHNFQMRSRDESGNKIKTEKLEDDLAREDLAASEDIKPSDTEVWWLQYLDGGKKLDGLESSNKFMVVFRILEECIALGDKILIFSTSLITLDSLEFFLKKINKWSLGQEYYRLDGSVPAEVRQKWCREFNAENNHKTKLFLISTRAGSLGLNMVAANRVIILDTSWNPAHDIQSIFRVYRFGQKKDCYIYRLVALGTMEQKIYERAVTKQAISCRVVDEQQIDRHYNMAELTELYRYDEAGVSVAGGVAVGVTDVALLRVARLAALHAVHEHDSLLSGSNEQGLPEHERAAAWMQFQQEHAHKQMQNQLTSSFTLQLPAKRPLDLDSTEQAEGQAKVKVEPGAPKDTKSVRQNLHKSKRGRKSRITPMPDLKTEGSQNVEPVPQPEPKAKRGRKPSRIAVQPEEPPVTKETIAVNDGIVQKIMDILVYHNYQNRQKPHEIQQLVSDVRKIVAFGKIPKGIFNKELTNSIANVLLGKDPSMPALTDVHQPAIQEFKETTQNTRSRSRKLAQTQAVPSTSTTTPTVKITDDGGRRRRRAAIAAEKQIDSIATDSVIELDGDDWQVYGSADPNDRDFVPKQVPSVKSPDKPKKPNTIVKSQKKDTVEKETPEKETLQKDVSQKETERRLNTEINSILLSDDDESPNPKKTQPKQNSNEIIPLHPSLLSNKNFIKIVAHTYLEGNPMLDEDAATLAAQYSTLKALQEYENTGKQIVSGPIYDIAMKVLGSGILEKLHKCNPEVKSAKPSASAVNTVKIESRETPRSVVKAKAISRLMEKPQNSDTVEFNHNNAALPQQPPAAPVVIPVGLIKMGANMPTNQPFEQPAREESILPDDEDITVIGDRCLPTPVEPTMSLVASNVRRNSQPLIMNAVRSQNITPKVPPIIIKKAALPKLQISGGRVITLTPSSVVSTTPRVINSLTPPTPVTVPIPTESQTNTICLDSDEEESITPNIEPPKKLKKLKRVALKSTAKNKVVPVSLTATNNKVVPVSITAANPHLNHLLSQPIMPMTFMSNMNTTSPLHQNGNYVVVPTTVMDNYTSVTSDSVLSAPHQNQIAPILHNSNIINSISQTVSQNVNATSSESILPTSTTTQHKRVPSKVSSLPKSSNTVCKPGDILRITKTGKVEILNRVDQNAASGSTGNDKLKPQTKPPEPEQLSVESPVTTIDDDWEPEVSSKKKLSKKKPTSAQKSRKSSSSSGSNSDSSRPPTPVDPLDILKDVVQIRAPDDVSEPKRLRDKKTAAKYSSNANKNSKNSITPNKTRSLLKKSKGLLTSTKGKAPVVNTPVPDKNQSSKINEKDKTPGTSTSSDKSCTNARPVKLKTALSNIRVPPVDSIDLTDLDCYPSTSKNTTISTNKVTAVKTDLKGKSTEDHNLFKQDQKKDSPIKVVGTSKNIIISATGKATTSSAADPSVKSIRVTNVEKIAVPLMSSYKPWSEAKKRPTPSVDSTSAKKKKSEPMTLKDFNIDDIDDIIELD